MKPSTYLEPIIAPLVDPAPVPPSTSSSSRDVPPVVPAGEPASPGGGGLFGALRAGVYSVLPEHRCYDMDSHLPSRSTYYPP